MARFLPSMLVLADMWRTRLLDTLLPAVGKLLLKSFSGGEAGCSSDFSELDEECLGDNGLALESYGLPSNCGGLWRTTSYGCASLSVLDPLWVPREQGLPPCYFGWVCPSQDFAK